MPNTLAPRSMAVFLPGLYVHFGRLVRALGLRLRLVSTEMLPCAILTLFLTDLFVLEGYRCALSYQSHVPHVQDT